MPLAEHCVPTADVPHLSNEELTMTEIAPFRWQEADWDSLRRPACNRYAQNELSDACGDAAQRQRIIRERSRECEKATQRRERAETARQTVQAKPRQTDFVYDWIEGSLYSRTRTRPSQTRMTDASAKGNKERKLRRSTSPERFVYTIVHVS